MKKWRVPINVLERGRVANIVAETKTEALKKLRNADWESLDDTRDVTFTKAGKIVEDTDD